MITESILTRVIAAYDTLADRPKLCIYIIMSVQLTITRTCWAWGAALHVPVANCGQTPSGSSRTNEDDVRLKSPAPQAKKVEEERHFHKRLVFPCVHRIGTCVGVADERDEPLRHAVCIVAINSSIAFTYM